MKAKVFQDTFEDIVKKQCLLKKNPIIIVSGLSDYIDFFQYEDHIADISTFDEEGNADYFDKTWFFNIFTGIGLSEDYIIVSHQQYAYIIENINSAYFSDRAILLYDNLRTLYPLYPDDYIEKKTEDDTEPRPEDMPVYQSEQFKIGDKFYYSLKRLDEGVVALPFFTKERDLTAADFRYSNDAVVDISTNPYAIDYFINECLEHNDFSRKFIVKTFPKQPLRKILTKNCESPIICFRFTAVAFSANRKNLYPGSINRQKMHCGYCIPIGAKKLSSEISMYMTILTMATRYRHYLKE